MTTPQPIQDLAAAGVSVWLDDLNRAMIASGELQDLVDHHGVVGITTNPTIFAGALAKSEAYTPQIKELLGAGRTNVDDAVFALTTRDVQDACDIMRPVWERTDGQDGRVSIEVDPRLAHDAETTIDMAQQLWETVDRPNVLIKIPATIEGLHAITECLSRGISVNVTLIFGLDRYRGVMNAFLTGLEQAREKGLALSGIRSVASFFVSRVDTEIDQRLDTLGTDEARALRGKAGIANARLAYQAFEEIFSTPRWANLADDGAHPQRPLWASTGVKDPGYPDTMYVTELVAPQTVNTMPDKTLRAVADHGVVTGNAIAGTYADSAAQLAAIERLGISYQQVVDQLEDEGVAKFEKSWDELLETVKKELATH